MGEEEITIDQSWEEFGALPLQSMLSQMERERRVVFNVNIVSKGYALIVIDLIIHIVEKYGYCHAKKCLITGYQK